MDVQFSLMTMPFFYFISVWMPVYSIPKLSATFLHVNFPSYVFTPEYITSFFLHAPSKPSFARASPYFNVAFVKAIVEVLGTAPGIFPTQ